MKAKIQKWGNSLAVRIPKSFAVETNLCQDSVVDMFLIDGDIVVKPNKPKSKYRLDDLLNDVNESNIHSETDWGMPVGKEVF
jgi:antitoxin MazE